MQAPLTVLFTSVGRRVELIRHFLDHASAHPNDLRVLGTEIDPTAPAAQVLGDGVRVVPRVDAPEYPTVIAELCRQEGVDVAFPLIDPDISRLAVIPGVPLASVTPDAAEIVSDKWLTYQWLVEHDIPTPESWLPRKHETLDFPVFMKPRRGSGGKDAFKVRSADEYGFLRTYIKQPIIQQLLTGPEVTVDVIVGREGEILATIQRQRLAVRGGEVSRGVVIDDPVVAEHVRHVVTTLGPMGPVTVQGMYSRGGSFHVTEINARMGGGIPLAVAAGAPVASLLVDSWLGREPEPIEVLDVGLHMVRFDDSFFYKP